MDMITMFALLAAIAAVISLFNGITSMAHGGESDDARRSNKLMFKRVGWQALAVFFILLGLLSQLK